jgi:hypothetical protein
MMQSDDGREEMRQGSFDSDKIAERVVEVRYGWCVGSISVWQDGSCSVVSCHSVC